jgi:hypothetical protein
LLNTNELVILNQYNLDILFKDTHSSNSNIVSITGVGQGNFVSVSSNGLEYLYSYSPYLFLNKKTSKGSINFCDVLYPSDIEDISSVKILNIPKCLNLYDEGTKINNYFTIECSDHLTYELSLPCDTADTLKITTTTNSYDIIVSPKEPPTYLLDKIEVNTGMIEIFDRLPLNANIKTIKFNKLNLGLIQYKVNDDYFKVEFDKEYDANLNFVYIINYDIKNYADAIIPFIIKDVYGISSDLISLKVIVNVDIPWYLQWYAIIPICLIIFVVFYKITDFIYNFCKRCDEEQTNYNENSFTSKSRSCCRWLKSQLCCCCCTDKKENQLIIQNISY